MSKVQPTIGISRYLKRWVTMPSSLWVVSTCYRVSDRPHCDHYSRSLSSGTCRSQGLICHVAALALAPGMISAANTTPAVSESLKEHRTPIIKVGSVLIGAGSAVVDLAFSRNLRIRSTIGSALACTCMRARSVGDRKHLARKPPLVLSVVGA